MTPQIGNPGTGFVVLGAGGHAASVADVLASIGGAVRLFVGSAGGRALPADTVERDGPALDFARNNGLRVVVGIGDNELRHRIFERVPTDLRSEAVAASTASVAATAWLEMGTIAHHHVHVGPRSLIGAAVIVNTAAVVEHDCTVGTGVHIAPGAILLGGSSVGNGSLIGAGARVLPGIKVGSGVVVGAGAVVTRDVPDGETVFGVPARIGGVS